jgi:hypothetical protein
MKHEPGTQHQADLKTMSQEEAERRRKLEQQNDEMLHQCQEEQARYRQELKQHKAALDAQQTMRKEHQARMMAVQERADREHREVVQEMLAAR